MKRHGYEVPTQDIDYVIEFMRKAHAGQKRRYTGEDYAEHPLSVARTVRDVVGDAEYRLDAIAAAMLHDTVEDTDITIDDIRNEFGDYVAELVGWLTDVSKPEDGNRKARKAIDRLHIADAPELAKTIKLADIIDNIGGAITEHDPHFAKVYMLEKAELLPALVGGDEGLWNKADKIISDYFDD